MYKIKRKKDYNGKDYYVIKKKVWFFWVRLYEYGCYEHAKKVLNELNNKQ
jgi:hypothetical protein